MSPISFNLLKAIGRTRKRFAARVLVGTLCLLGTLAGAQRSAADSPAARAHAANAQLRVVALPDPSFGGMPAVFVAVPKEWKVTGQMTMNPCVSLPSPSWSASSSDGQSSFDVLPEFAWRLGNGVRFGQGCDPLKGTPSAAEFLSLFAAKLPNKVQIVGRIQVADAFRSREEKFTAAINGNNVNAPPALRMRSIGDVASLKATDDTGHELRIRGWLQCRQGNGNGDCFARVDVVRTPKGKLDGLIALVDGANLAQEVPDEKWQAAYLARQQHVGRQRMDELTKVETAGNDMLHQQYVQSSARLQREHEAGLAQIERVGHDANANATAALNARTTAASDWRDYAADQQTVSGVNGTYKTSSQYTNVWSSPYGPAMSNGRTFGSMDNTADPNSATDQTWTQDTKVHGNGQPF